MNEYQLERIYQLELRKKEMIMNMADKIVPVIGEYIQETIAWQTDDEYGWDALEGDLYIEYCNELRTKILQDLMDI